MFKHWRTEEDKKIDLDNGIERNPTMGCFIAVLGSILFWCGIYWLWVSL